MSFVDCELIILCEENSAVLFSDDTRLINIAVKEFGIRTFDLCDILIALKKRNRLSQDQIEEIIIMLEKKDHYLFNEDSKRSLRS